MIIYLLTPHFGLEFSLNLARTRPNLQLWLHLYAAFAYSPDIHKICSSYEIIYEEVESMKHCFP